MTEQEMRESEVPTFDTVEELNAYIKGLVEQQHDYGTCVYAMSMSAVATFNYVARKLQVTGFQASCADLDILHRTRNWKWGTLLNYEELLYPQYQYKFKNFEQLLEENKVELAKRAKDLMQKDKDLVHKSVWSHWERLSMNGEEVSLTECLV
jgi:hypothetical protein